MNEPIEHRVITEIGSILEYLIDRNDIELITKVVETSCTRYTDEVVKYIDVIAEGKTVRITAEVVP